jgi:hypothetical protein
MAGDERGDPAVDRGESLIDEVAMVLDIGQDVGIAKRGIAALLLP